MSTGAVKKGVRIPAHFCSSAPPMFFPRGRCQQHPARAAVPLKQNRHFLIDRSLFKARVKCILDINIVLNRIK